MNLRISTIALIAGLSLSTGALAQETPSGGPAAKGNAPLKHAHTVNDGAAKGGANSFTQSQAQKHILNSGYTNVSGLTKGSDGVWRGTATKDGSTRDVALDFKGNVSESGAVAQSHQAVKAAGMKPAPVVTSKTTVALPTSSSTPASASGAKKTTMAASSSGDKSHPHHLGTQNCADPGPNGAACSGRDSNGNGISDKEDKAIKTGANP